MSTKQKKHLKRGFTLVELLVVIAIIGILIALLLPAVQAAREAARRMQCINGMRQMGIGLLNYESTHKVFPPGRWMSLGHNWSTLTLPFMELESLYEEFDLSLAWDHPSHLLGGEGVVYENIPVYLCPSNQKYIDGQTDYACIQGVDYLIPGTTTDNNSSSGHLRCGVLIADYTFSFRDISDGASNTMMISEDGTQEPESRKGVPVYGTMWKTTMWACGGSCLATQGTINAINDDSTYEDLFYGLNEIHSSHPGGANGLFVDGSVHFLPEDIDSEVVIALITRSQGEIIDKNSF